MTYTCACRFETHAGRDCGYKGATRETKQRYGVISWSYYALQIYQASTQFTGTGWNFTKVDEDSCGKNFPELSNN